MIAMGSSQMYPGEVGILRMRRLYAQLKKSSNFCFKVIHVAGTSGKGSTTLIASLILQKLGYKVGVFITPYLHLPEECIQINGQFSQKRLLAKAKKIVEKAVIEIETPEMGEVSYFERLTATALVYFTLQKVDVVIFETAMGGLFDATNVVESDVAIVTPVSFDHTRLLGNNIADIAHHKAGIIKKSNRAVVVSRQVPRVLDIIENTAHSLGVASIVLGRDFEVDTVQMSEEGTVFSYRSYGAAGGVRLQDMRLSLIGAHQADNAAVALTAVRALLGTGSGKAAFEKAARAALKRVKNPGRFDIERHGSKIVVKDVAHNPAKIASVISTFKTLYPGQKALLIFSCKWTKDIETMAHQLKAIADTVLLTTFKDKNNPDVNRVMAQSKLLETFAQEGFATSWYGDPSQALIDALASEHTYVIITGSFHLLRSIKAE